MNCRAWLAVSVAIVAASGGAAETHQKYICDQNCRRKDAPCPSPCRACPAQPPCPAAECPRAKCPPPPPRPRCPAPICPTLPDVPPCPLPVVNLTCPPPVCGGGARACEICPVCPARPECPTAGAVTSPPAGNHSLNAAAFRQKYKLYANSKSWTDANKTCSSVGAHLAIPNSEDELATLIKMVKNAGRTSVHIGFYRENNGNFSSALGEPMDSYQNSLWKAGEPNLSWKCVSLASEGLKITSEPCTDLLAYLCEFQ